MRNTAQPKVSGDAYQRNRVEALEAWAHIVAALRASDQAGDRELAQRIGSFIQESAFAKEQGRIQEREMPFASLGRYGTFQFRGTCSHASTPRTTNG